MPDKRSIGLKVSDSVGWLFVVAVVLGLFGAGCVERFKGLVRIQEVPATSGTDVGAVRAVPPPIPDSLKGLR